MGGGANGRDILHAEAANEPKHTEEHHLHEARSSTHNVHRENDAGVANAVEHARNQIEQDNDKLVRLEHQ